MWRNETIIWAGLNTTLALIPVVLAYVIKWLAELPGRRAQLLVKAPILVVGLAWLAFLPNTCYLLTEWRHFLIRVGSTDLYLRWQVESRAALLLMIYTLFYLCYSSVGVLTFTLAIRPVVRLARRNGTMLWVWGMPFFLLMSVGVYLGLVLRYNTWDLIIRPAEVWAAITELQNRPMLATFIIFFGGFLWLAYLAADVWIDGLNARCGGSSTHPVGNGESGLRTS